MVPMNYIRNVSFHIKAGKTDEFNKTFTADVLPIMRKQPGFKHELAMINGSDVVGVSVWQDQPSAEKYSTSAYPEVLKKLSTFIEGSPSVKGYELTASTLG